MTIEDKLQLNKLIKSYEGDNTFLLSLKKQLKSNKFLNKVEYKGKMVKILSDKQYEISKSLL